MPKPALASSARASLNVKMAPVNAYRYHAEGERRWRRSNGLVRNRTLLVVDVVGNEALDLWTCPDEYYLLGKLWTHGIVQQPIERDYGRCYSFAVISQRWHQLGLSTQRPLHRSIRQDPEAMAH